MIPTVLIAAPSSGSGKTTVMCAIAAALKTRGMDVRTFKAGPDYLDPTWHRVVTGRPSRNLDGWMTGADGVKASFVRGARGGDIALIEGVMGLFDGRSPRTLEGSGAELARWLGVPVVVVIDAGGMARTAAAVVAGLAGYEPGVDVTGVVFNRVGSAGHGKLLAEAMETVPSVRYVGALTRQEGIAVPERHLGLVSGALAARPGWVAELAAWGETLDLDALLKSARVADVRELAEAAPAAPIAGARARIGVARDAAFHFYYEDNLDLLRESGAELVEFSPLDDVALPDVDGLYIGGGYPEEHHAALSANVSMRAAIKTFAGVIYAECGGLMYLGETLDDTPMCGRLPVRTRMTSKLRTLGYREVITTSETPLGPAGTQFRGHEFHYSELVSTDLSPAYWMRGRGGEGVEGWAQGPVLGSYVHAHFGSNPSLAQALVDACVAASPRAVV